MFIYIHLSQYDMFNYNKKQTFNDKNSFNTN